MFNIKNSKDRLVLLKSDYAKLIRDPLNISLAEKAISDAWHLGDWVLKERQSNGETINKERFRQNLYHECPKMKILYDIANTIKHKELDHPKTQIKETKNHSGDYSTDYSSDYNISRLEIHFENKKRIDVADLLKVTIKYWETTI